MKPAILLLLGLVALGSSTLRFGERENEALPLSDSDYYLDMARVFAGEAAEFRLDPRAPAAAHHYSRPGLPFAAGLLGRHVLGGNYRAAFSVLNILAAWAVAAGLYGLLLWYRPGMPHAWAPSVLFLTGFPQLNWGYHLLTDTAGYATAFLAALYVAWLCQRWSPPLERLRDARLLGGLGVLFVLQAIAFLTRETAWMVPIVALVVLARRGFFRAWRGRAFAVALLATTVAARIPHALYASALGVAGPEIHLAVAPLLDPWYALDFVVKSAVAFHVAWPLALLALARRSFGPLPPLVLGWTLAAALYIGAGYAHNALGMVGYPLRLTYALFPMVFLLAVDAIDRFAGPDRRALAIGGFVALSVAVSVLGVFLDPAEGAVTVPDLMP